MNITIYGIKNCDTMKKALKWFDENNVSYEFHDYKKSGVPADKIPTWIAQLGWETIINKRGTTYRKLDDATKASLDTKSAVDIAINNTSIIKRPLIEYGDQVLTGFNTEQYQQTFLK